MNKAVFRICDNLQFGTDPDAIRILGSLPLTDADPDVDLYQNFQPLFQSAQHFFEKREGSGRRIRIRMRTCVLTDPGCGSGSPKNKQILWIRMRIRNTGIKYIINTLCTFYHCKPALAGCT
jgi:hypothetical protein